MSAQAIHNFGLVDENGDVFEFTIDVVGNGSCRLIAVLQTERGPRRTEVAAISTEQWNEVAAAAVKELAAEMGENEREKKAPSLRPGINRISPLVGRELGVLLIALMEDGAAQRMDALLHAWRELAREERWWLYAKAAAPGQRVGAGWRKALFHALSETSETRAAPPVKTPRKKLWEHQETVLAGASDNGESLLDDKLSARIQGQGSKARRFKRKSSEAPDDGQMRLRLT